MKRLHPLSRDLYEQFGEDRVRVETTDGRSGVFIVNTKTQPPTVDWESGDLKDTDPNMALWVAQLRDFTNIR